jgi:hypothetical protein
MCRLAERSDGYRQPFTYQRHTAALLFHANQLTVVCDVGVI